MEAIRTACKQKFPKEFNFDEIARNANAITLSEVINLEIYSSRSDDVRRKITRQYFTDIIQPRVHPDYVTEARTQFDSYLRGLERRISQKNAQIEKDVSNSEIPPTIKPPLNREDVNVRDSGPQ